MREEYPPLVKVTKNGRCLGPALYELAHPKNPFTPGIRHLTSNIFIFEDSTCSRLLLTRRAMGIDREGVLNVCAGGNAIWLMGQGRAQTPLEAAISELDEVFYKTPIPESLRLEEVTHFPKDLRRNDPEYVYLFEGFYPGPFNLHPQECSEAFFMNTPEVMGDLIKNPDKYVKSATLYLKKYMEVRNL